MIINFPDSLFKLSRNEVHVWYVNYNINNDENSFLNNILSKDEIQKASQFRFKKDKNCSIISRGALRHLSGKYLKEKPEDIKFKYGEFGKPYYDMETKLKFNISHSGNMIVLGFVLKHEIGIDIEKIKSDFEVLDIASNYFSNSEIESLKQLPINNHVKGFYRCWTRKESFIKAKGKGLSFPLDSFSVSIDSDLKAKLLDTSWNPVEKNEWQLFTLNPNKSYLGAISVHRNIKNIKILNFSF